MLIRICAEGERERGRESANSEASHYQVQHGQYIFDKGADVGYSVWGPRAQGTERVREKVIVVVLIHLKMILLP